MSSKGYNFESEVEDWFLAFTGQNKHDPILKADDKGLIHVNRSFRIPSSGAMDSLKGDILTAIPGLPRQIKVECKSRYEHTKKDGQMIIVEKEWLSKNEAEAKADNQIPVLTFSFKRLQKDRIWWIIKKADFGRWFNVMLPEIPQTIKPQESKKKDTLKFAHKDLVSKKCLIFLESNTNESYLLLSHTTFGNVLTSVLAT